MPIDAVGAMPAVSVTDSAAKVVFAPLGEGAQRRLRVAGMAELVGANLRIDDERIAQLAESTERVFGAGAQGCAPLRPWAGLRPATPTGRPCIGQAGRWRNVWINGGQGALGFTLAFGSAAVLAAQMAGAVSPLGASAAMQLSAA